MAGDDGHYGDWDSYDSFEDALEDIYEHFMPEGIDDNWADALFAAGEYGAWADYMFDEYGWDIDMAEFWDDFRDAYDAV